jgi:hypothetical protein
MKYLAKNFYFLLLAIIIFLAHQIIYQDFFPNKNLLLGNDYSLFLPQFIFGKVWFNNNFLTIPWFSPSFCCGLPFYGDPQTMYYSLQQLFFILFSPLTSLKLMYLFFSFACFLGTFLLLHKSFNRNIYISLIAATLLLFNGFFNYRFIIGHLTYVSFIFIPLYCYLLIKSFESERDSTKSIFYILVSSLLLTHIIQSSLGPSAIIVILSIIFVISIHIYVKEKLKIINYLILSFVIALLIAISKINASLSFLSNFPREYPPIVFENYYEFASNIFKSLFLYPDATKFNSNAIIDLPYKIGLQELEYSISIVPLLIFSIFIFNLKKFNIKKFTKEKLIAVLIMIILVLFVTTINISDNEIGAFFRKLPLIKSSWVNYRFISIFILPLIIISCLIIDKIFIKENNIKIFTFLCLSLILFHNYYYKKDFYHKQNYNPESFEKIHINKEKIKNLKIKDTVLITDKNNKILTNRQRNNLFIHELSPLFCYQPLFGYQLEFMPKNNLKFDKKNKISENLFYYTGNPKSVVEDKLNFLNPSCFIFPKENNCMPGDMFKKTQINELENFLNYKAFKFKLSKLQKIFNYISLISLIFSICFITYYLIKKIISNKSSDEQNH